MRQIVLSALVALALALTGAGEALAKAGTTSKASGTTAGSRGSKSIDPSTLPMGTLAPPSPSAARANAAPPPPPQAAPRTGNVEAQPLQPAGIPNSATPYASPRPYAAPTPSPAAPGYSAANPGYAAAAPAAAMAKPGFAQRSPFLAGLTGGLVGVGLGSLLFGHDPALAQAVDASPTAGIIGLLLQVGVIGGLLWLAYKLFRGRAPAGPNPYAAPVGLGRNAYAGPALGGAREPQFTPRHEPGPREPQLDLTPAASTRPAAPPPPAPAERAFEPTESDQGEFTQVLLGVQQAWSVGDINALRQWATPEMAASLANDLAQNAAEGIVNRVERVVLRRGEVMESWREPGFEYLTARLGFDCLDYMVRRDNGAVIGGSQVVPQHHTEAWTFVRAETGGPWRLSAIQPA
ncbi:TIM44-like domain-containing protein [Phaeospirillum tilakii]|uniref:TIM44-like domain-containing protein n=1 Tax=Phaeospirillum tilakii TaxID=741673 RepID=A0ABW5C9D3_9PROT